MPSDVPATASASAFGAAAVAAAADGALSRPSRSAAPPAAWRLRLVLGGAVLALAAGAAGYGVREAWLAATLPHPALLALAA
ncbi:MAG: hypothetical protein KGL78_05015, partial [Burkholderiales bacterium]|nr:hypothetical protein [Burkholderiales bacterium]